MRVIYLIQKKDTRQAFVLPVLYPYLWIVYFANFVNSICYKLTCGLFKLPNLILVLNIFVKAFCYDLTPFGFICTNHMCCMS